MSNTALQEPVNQENPPSSVGETLRAARLARGLTLEEASHTLRISLSQLSSLEDNEENLMCDVYTLGFLKLYAHYLGLDAQNLIQRFKDQVTHHPKSNLLIFPAPLPGRGIPSRAILTLCFCALMAIIIGWWWLNPAGPIPTLAVDLPKTEESILKVKTPPVPVEEPVPPVLSSPSVEDASLAAPLSVTPTKVDLHVTEKTWIEVKDQEGKVIVNKIFYPGESFEFKDGENLVLTTGNLKGTHLSSGDKIFPTSAKSGEVKRDIPLNPQKWLEEPRESGLNSPH